MQQIAWSFGYIPMILNGMENLKGPTTFCSLLVDIPGGCTGGWGGWGWTGGCGWGQLFSSSPPAQSVAPSHFLLSGMQMPLAQVNSPAVHAADQIKWKRKMRLCMSIYDNMPAIALSDIQRVHIASPTSFQSDTALVRPHKFPVSRGAPVRKWVYMR